VAYKVDVVVTARVEWRCAKAVLAIERRGWVRVFIHVDGSLFAVDIHNQCQCGSHYCRFIVCGEGLVLRRRWSFCWITWGKWLASMCAGRGGVLTAVVILVDYVGGGRDERLHGGGHWEPKGCCRKVSSRRYYIVRWH